MRRAIHGIVLTCVLTAVGSFSGCATYSNCRAPECADDARLTVEVQSALAQDMQFLSGSIYPRTYKRVVYLYGVADSNLERLNAEATARAIAGVVKVVNFIGVYGR